MNAYFIAAGLYWSIFTLFLLRIIKAIAALMTQKEMKNCMLFSMALAKTCRNAQDF